MMHILGPIEGNKNKVSLALTAEVEVEGKTVKALLDMGSPMTILSVDLLFNHWAQHKKDCRRMKGGTIKSRFSPTNSVILEDLKRNQPWRNHLSMQNVESSYQVKLISAVRVPAQHEKLMKAKTCKNSIDVKVALFEMDSNFAKDSGITMDKAIVKPSNEDNIALVLQKNCFHPVCLEEGRVLGVLQEVLNDTLIQHILHHFIHFLT